MRCQRRNRVDGPVKIMPMIEHTPGPTGMKAAHGRKSILLITPENPEINRVRRRQLNNFTQITMPYLAGFIDEARYQIELVDEYNQRIPYERPADIVAITVNTPNATHCYRMAARFRAGGARVVMGGPHATLRADEAAQHCDHLVVGEAEETWPQFLDEFHRGCARPRYTCDRTPSLHGLPIPRRDLIRHRHFTEGGGVRHPRVSLSLQLLQPQTDLSRRISHPSGA